MRPSPDLLIEEGFLPPYKKRDKDFGKVVPTSPVKKPVSAKYVAASDENKEDEELGGKPLEIGS